MSSPVNIPESVSLALHALARLAAEEEVALKLADLLVKPGSPDHLSKVMQRLARAGMVSSRRGRGGGFTLAVSPGDIRLMDVWIALEGTFQSGICPLKGKVCPLRKCIFGSMASDAAGIVSDYLRSTTVADLAGLFSRSNQWQD
ncbi:MAG: Rrf2 family transcriptional regulator [Candidatus Fermentibacteraceae bacterium]|nr:Rrf2 family transcriptional regulator [Candidatus Fermentibacteraceae bacterium]